jgi:hypothetical protein
MASLGFLRMADDSSSGSGSSGNDLARHILPTSGTMIGVCITLIGLVKLFEDKNRPTRTDEFGAIIAVVFLGSAFLSYLSMRTSGPSHRYERYADMLFLVGLASIVLLAGLFAFEWI